MAELNLNGESMISKNTKLLLLTGLYSSILATIFLLVGLYYGTHPSSTAATSNINSCPHDSCPEHFSGGQESLLFFRSRPNVEKKQLKTFTLSNARTLETSKLLADLEPCTNLESIVLDQVTLFGKFPQTKLYFPNLVQFKLKIRKWNGIGFTEWSDMFFFYKDTNKQQFDMEKFGELETNIEIQYKGSTFILLDFITGELVLDFGYQNQIKILKGLLDSSSSKFKLFSLTLADPNGLNTSWIPNTLTYFKIEHYRFTNDTIIDYSFLNRLYALEDLHINVKGVFEPTEEIQLADLSSNLKTLSLSGVILNFGKNQSKILLLEDLEQLYLDECKINLDEFKYLFQRGHLVNLQRIVIGLSFLVTDICHPIIYEFTNSSSILSRRSSAPKLNHVYVKSCNRENSEGLFIERFNETEAFLSGLGLNSYVSDFILERDLSTGIWSGRRATKYDQYFHEFYYTDTHKFNTWEQYAKRHHL